MKAPLTFTPLAMMILIASQASAQDQVNTEQTQQTQDKPVAHLGILTVTADQNNAIYQQKNSSSATGLNLKLQETPQSVSITTKQFIQDKKLNSVTDALMHTAGMTILPMDSGRSEIGARGFYGNVGGNFQINGVSLYSDNTLSPATTDTSMYERVEVTRGATGLMMGTGEPSAGINLIRKQATAQDFTGTMGLTLGSWGHKKIHADIQSPLSADGSLRARLVASYLLADGFRDLEKRKHGALYATLDGDVGKNTDVSVGISYDDRRLDAPYWGGLPIFFTDGTRTDWARNKTNAADWNYWNTYGLKFFADVNHHFDNGMVWKNNLLYSKAREDSDMLWVTGEVDRQTGLGLSAEPYRYLGSPKNLQLDSKLTLPFVAFNYPQELMLGATLSHAKAGWLNGSEKNTYTLGSLFDWDGKVPKSSYGKLGVGNDFTNQQKAIYAASRLQVAKDTKVIVGGRMTHWRQDNRQGEWTPEAFVQKETALTPYLGVVYDLSDDSHVYASYTNIFNPQDNKDKNGKTLAPIKGNSYEIGIKKSWLDGNFSTHASLYKTVQDNFALADGKIGNSNQDAFKAVKGAKVTGFELEMVGRPLANLDMTGSVSVFHAKKTPDGEHLSKYAPRKNLKLFGKYDLSAYVSGLSVGAGVNWYSQPPATAENPKTKQPEKSSNPAYAVMDVMAHYRINDQLSAQLNVSNALDKSYYYENWNSINYGEPRNIKVSLDYHF